MSLSEEAKPMTGQVGGVSNHKAQLLTLKPDYCLKPVQNDHRGIREIAFYEAIRFVSTSTNTSTYAAFLKGKEPIKSFFTKTGEIIDTIALAINILVHDPVVTESELALKDAWKVVRKEVEVLHKLAKFLPTYYGVMGNQAKRLTLDGPYCIDKDAHLLLQDVTANFSKPCVMDLKMGAQSYEPDAIDEKRQREISKYPQQALYGFRIVGMRIYDPQHPDADAKGFRLFEKGYGRSIETADQLEDAFRTFFSAGITPKDDGEPDERVRRRAISNLLVQLRPLRRWFEENMSFRFYASSILIVYEGDTTKQSGNRDITSVRMIDFGRVRREAGLDTGYIAGLRTLKRVLTDIVENETDRIGGSSFE